MDFGNKGMSCFEPNRGLNNTAVGRQLDFEHMLRTVVF